MLQAPLVLASRTQASRVLLSVAPGTVAYGGSCTATADCAPTKNVICSNNVCTGTVSNGDTCSTNTDCATTTSTCTSSKCTGEHTVDTAGTCTADSDCKVSGSSCLNTTCSDPHSVAAGQTCKTASDCMTLNATCTSQVCTAPGTVNHTGACTAQSDCAVGLTCGINTKTCLAPGESDSIATPSPSPVSSPSSTTPTSPTSIIKVAFSATLPAFTVATFQAQQQSDFKAAVLSKAMGATTCALSNLHDGSLLLDSTVTFPNSNANAASNAASFKNVLATNSSAVFPSATYGAVTVGKITSTSGHPGLALSSVVLFVAFVIIGIAQ
ncbi:hypothetical protein ABBQ38_009362 [Trebouxia sp. C0009 RCD-2024]